MEHGDERAFALSLRRLIVQTKPTAIICAKPRSFRGVRAALRVIATVAAHSGLPLVSLAGEILRELVTEVPDDNAVTCQYPELRGLDSSVSTDAIRLALASFAKIPLPPRRYAPTLSANPSSSVDHRRNVRARKTPLRDGKTTRCRP